MNEPMMAERAQYWFKRIGEAQSACRDGEVPRMTVTPEELEELRQYGKPFESPWFKEIAMYAGVALDVAENGDSTGRSE